MYKYKYDLKISDCRTSPTKMPIFFDFVHTILCDILMTQLLKFRKNTLQIIQQMLRCQLTVFK